jgi:hypothetical protein
MFSRPLRLLLGEEAVFGGPRGEEIALVLAETEHR